MKVERQKKEERLMETNEENQKDRRKRNPV